jgi:hypothetical protein
MSMMRALLALLLLSAPAQAQTIAWIKWDPAAIRSNRTAPATVEMMTTGAVPAVRLDYAAGGSLTLASAGANRWTGTVPAAQLLFDYASDDVNHNFVGFFRLLGSSGETLVTYNGFVNVVDERVAAARIRQIDPGARATERILNLYRPAITPTDVRSAIQQFYTYFRDDFDFLQVVYTLPSYPANRYHFAVRNNVQGIGLAVFNDTALYGSAGRLQGVTVFPIDFFFDAADTTFSHELGHQWINFLHHSLLQPGIPHWPPSTMAQGIMGWNIPGTNVGGQFPYRIEMNSATTARVTAATVSGEFSDFDLYLMGLIPPSAVSPGIVVSGTLCADCVLPATQITVADIIGADGPRVPDAASAPKSFRIATVVISRDRLLNDDELALLDYFAARGEATETLPYTSGFARGTTKPFYVATRGIGRVDFRLEHPPRRRSVRH